MQWVSAIHKENTLHRGKCSHFWRLIAELEFIKLGWAIHVQIVTSIEPINNRELTHAFLILKWLRECVHNVAIGSANIGTKIWCCFERKKLQKWLVMLENFAHNFFTFFEKRLHYLKFQNVCKFCNNLFLLLWNSLWKLIKMCNYFGQISSGQQRVILPITFCLGNGKLHISHKVLRKVSY